MNIRELGLRVGVVAATASLVALTAACGGESSGLSEQAERGQSVARANGCASCHGSNGQGGVGPSWIDLAGSERTLTDESTVVADDDYLVRAILEPQEEVVEGFTIRMPTNGLDEAQALDVVAYIKELTSDGE